MLSKGWYLVLAVVCLWRIIGIGLGGKDGLSILYSGLWADMADGLSLDTGIRGLDLGGWQGFGGVEAGFGGGAVARFGRW